MKEFTVRQIAAALLGHPGSAEQELRLLRLFETPTPTPTLPLKGEGNEKGHATLPLKGPGNEQSHVRELKKAA